MLKALIERLEELEDLTLEENVRLCGALEAEAAKRRLFRRAAWAVHLLLFTVAALLCEGFLWMEALVEHGREAAIPERLRGMFVQGLAADGLTGQYKAFFLLVGILLLLPLVTDIIFAVLGRAVPEDGPVPGTEAAASSADERKKLDFIETSLDRSYEALGAQTLTFGGSWGGLLLHGLCIALSLLFFYICFTAIQEGNLAACLFSAALWWLLCELAFLIPGLAVSLLFACGSARWRISKVRSRVPHYGTRLHLEYLERKEAARLAAMSPEERQRAAEERRLREEEERRQEAAEKADFEHWLAGKRCVCRYYNAGQCNYSHSTCYYPSEPERCGTALSSGGLIYIDK